jgi:hypothetical protein
LDLGLFFLDFILIIFGKEYKVMNLLTTQFTDSVYMRGTPVGSSPTIPLLKRATLILGDQTLNRGTSTKSVWSRRTRYTGGWSLLNWTHQGLREEQAMLYRATA